MPERSVVTFLFTDIEGSTRLWEAHPDAMEVALARHDELLRVAIESEGGVVFKTVGDAFYATFPAVSDSVRGATAAQCALAQELWPPPVRLRVRMAIHTGECTHRGGDFFGPTLNRVARLLAIGNGGQVLVSESSRLAPGEPVPTGVSLRDMGEHRLKDLGRPEHVFQVCVEGVDDVTRPLRSSGRARHNLPRPLTSFVGREPAVETVLARLERARLVTVTGAGGCGKTRLALRVGEEMVARTDSEVWVVELASVRDPENVAVAVAAALDVRTEGAIDVAADIADALVGRTLVLLLDNCEHVLEPSAALTQNLLHSCGGVTVLATSREPLGVSGESVYQLDPLVVPEPGVSAPGELVAIESVRLLVDRVHEQQAAFVIDDRNAAAVADICRRLDGIPLALELVAARANVLSLEELRNRLDERFGLLTRGSRSALPHHRTLRALIDWSYDLLSPAEQRTLARCAAFVGTFDLEAAEAVCGRAPIATVDVMDHITALVTKSLIQRDVVSGWVRFRLLETVREYAVEQLSLGEDELEDTLAAHCEHFAALAERTEPQLVGPRQREGFERLAADLDNFRAALRWASHEPERSEQGLRLSGALALHWFACGLYREGLDQTVLLLSSAAAADPVRARALWSAGLMATLLGEGDRAQSLLYESLDLARRGRDRSLIARTLDVLGLLAFFRNDLTSARHLLEESVVEAREIDDRWCLADALGTLSSILPLVGEIELADQASSETLAIARGARDEQGTRMALFGIALTASRQDDLTTLRDAGDEGLEICRAIGDSWFIAYFLWLLGIASVQLGELERARLESDECLALARRLEAPLLIVCGLEAVAAVARAVGDPTIAWLTLEEARRVSRSEAVPGAYVSSVTRALGELAAEAGRVDEAVALFGEAAEIADGVGDRWGVARVAASLDSVQTR